MHAGRRGIDIAGLPVKKLSFNNLHAPCEVEMPPRRPFAPLVPVNSIPSTPSQPNIMFTPSILSTPSLPRNNDVEEENRTPKLMPISTPETPVTVPASMQMATTPAPTCLVYEAAVTKAPLEEMEYSFEERRLAFYRNRESLVDIGSCQY